MTHPDRLRWAEALREHHPELDLEIVVDPAPDVPGCLRTAQAAWRAVAPDATHHLVLSDDALPCQAFLRHLTGAIAAAPEHPLTLFTEWGSHSSYGVRLAAMAGLAWAEVTDHYVPHIGIVLPAPLARAFGHFSGYRGPEDDVALHVFLSRMGMTARASVPNLVDHAHVPSLTGNDWQGERPSACLPADGDAQPAWSTEPPVLPALPVVWWPTGDAVWMVRAAGSPNRWDAVPAASMLPSYGADPAEVAALGRAAIGPRAAAMPDLDPRYLLALWTTAYGLGLLLADIVGTDPAGLEQALARPLARRALATMPGGALRFLVDARRLAEVSPDLGRLVHQALHQGHAARRATWASHVS